MNWNNGMLFVLCRQIRINSLLLSFWFCNLRQVTFDLKQIILLLSFFWVCLQSQDGVIVVPPSQDCGVDERDNFVGQGSLPGAQASVPVLAEYARWFSMPSHFCNQSHSQQNRLRWHRSQGYDYELPRGWNLDWSLLTAKGAEPLVLDP